MRLARTKAKILKNIPTTVYEGQVYDQTVYVELQDGTIIHLFDDIQMRSKDEMVGTIRTLGVSVYCARFERLASPAKGVHSRYRSPDDKVGIEKEPIVFFGDIVAIDTVHPAFTVDIGMGTIDADICGEELPSFPDYRIGDYISFRGWINLSGVWDLNITGGNGWAHIVANHVNTPSGNQFYSAFGPDYVKREGIKDLIMTGARNGVEVGKNVYRYVEPTSGRTLRLLVADSGYIVTAHPETRGIPTGILKEDLEIPVRIVGVRPDAEYDGHVYTQVALVEFADGTRASVFDNDLLCTPAMVGRAGKVVLRMLVDSLEKIETADRQVYAESAMPLMEINGRIDAIIVPDNPEQAERWHDAVVGFGLGEVLIEIDKRYFSRTLKEGDYVRVDGRVDLKSVT